MQQEYAFPEFAPPAAELVGASTGQRFANYLIDMAAFYLSCLVLGVGLGVVLGLTGHTDLLATLQGPASSLLGVVLMLAYYFVLEVSTGRTIGKLFTRTRVVMDDGSPLTTRAALLRTLGRIIPFEAFSFVSSESGWHDTLSKTRVVRVAR